MYCFHSIMENNFFRLPTVTIVPEEKCAVAKMPARFPAEERAPAPSGIAPLYFRGNCGGIAAVQNSMKNY